MEAHSERKLVKKWVTAKIKEIADHGVAGWVIKREHPVLQSSQDPGAQDENDAAGGMPATSLQPTPALDLPPQHTGDALPSFCLCNDDALMPSCLSCELFEICKDHAAAQGFSAGWP